MKVKQKTVKDGTKQARAYAVAGQPMVSNVMQGYNACCFAYGQTGAGKTHTMQGELGSQSGCTHEMRGLAPRVFQQVFQVCNGRDIDFVLKCAADWWSTLCHAVPGH